MTYPKPTYSNGATTRYKVDSSKPASTDHAKQLRRFWTFTARPWRDWRHA